MKKRSILFLICLIIILQIPCLGVFAEVADVPDVTAQNVVMINTNTGAVVYEKSPDEQIYPASLTKLVSLLVAADLITDYDEVITISKSCYDDLVVGSSNINLKDGEKMKIDDLMYAIAISSANEACNTIAAHLCGSIGNFVEKMNEKAEQLGAVNTHFVNTHGLHDPQHYTTAHDMSLIAKAAFSNERILKYLSTSTHVIEATNTSESRTLITTNNLLRPNSGAYYKYCRAGKTGTTTPAGYNLISIANKGDCEFILVAMNVNKAKVQSNTVFSDSKSLYTWAFENYKNSKVLDGSEIVAEVEVKLSAKGDHLILIPESNIYSVIPSDMDISTLERDIMTQENILAPVAQGDVLGTITLKKDGIVYATANLVAADDVSRSTVLYYLHLIEIFFKNIWVRIICVILAILVIVYIIVMISQNRKRKRRRLKHHIRF